MDIIGSYKIRTNKLGFVHLPPEILPRLKNERVFVVGANHEPNKFYVLGVKNMGYLEELIINEKLKNWVFEVDLDNNGTFRMEKNYVKEFGIQHEAKLYDHQLYFSVIPIEESA